MTSSQTFANRSSDHQRAWEMCSLFLETLQSWASPFDDSLLLRAASNFAYMVPEGMQQRYTDNWTFEAIPRAFAGGDKAAMQAVVSHYVTHADTEREAGTALNYRMLLIAFCVTADAPRRALDECKPGFQTLSTMAVPRMTEGIVLAWCLAMHALTRLKRDERSTAAFGLNQNAQSLSAQLKQRFDNAPDRSKDKDFLYLCTRMSDILAGCAFYVASFGGGPNLMKPDPMSLMAAQQIEQQTGGQWPVANWVRAAGRHGS